jgi:hypothetical protein
VIWKKRNKYISYIWQHIAHHCEMVINNVKKNTVVHNGARYDKYKEA